MELRALRVLKREARPAFTFVSERGAPFTVAGLGKLIERVGVAAKIGFKVHPHVLRHAAGFVLANKGTDTCTLQAYLGHPTSNRPGATPSSRQVALRTFGAKACN